MAEPLENTQTVSRSVTEVIQPWVTIVIALLTGWISFQQYQISSLLDQQRQTHTERIAITEQSVELLKRAEEYLAKFKLEDDAKVRVLISLLAIEKDIRMSLTGEINTTEVREQVHMLPLHLALLTKDSESLAHIGGSLADLNRWLPIAEASGDTEIRLAAIIALKKIGELSDNAEVIIKCVDSISNLTQSWNVPKLRTEGIDAVRRIAEVVSKSEIKDRDALNRRIVYALREVEGANTPVVPFDKDLKDLKGGTLEDAQRKHKVANAEQRGMIRTLRERYETRADAESETAGLLALIEDLEMTETPKRRLARSKIADYGAKAVGPLLEALAKPGSSYRLRLGVATSLMLMRQPLELGRDQLDAIVSLLGDSDKTVRKNTSIFLGQLTDPATLDVATDALTWRATTEEYYDNPVYIYNCVVVLADWLRWNESVRDSQVQTNKIEASLSNIKGALETDDRKWTRALGQIAKRLTRVN